MLPRPAVLRRGLLAASLAAPAILRAQPALTRLALLLDWKAMPTYAGFFLARELGLFARHGLEVDLQPGHGATIATRMIADSQEYWVGTSSGAATAIGVSQGLRVKSLAVLYRSTPSVLFSRPEAPIRRPAELAGKRVGLVPGSVTVDEFHGLLAANGLDRSQVTEVAVPWTAQPLLDGTVDALIDYEEMLPAELQAAGRDVALLRLAEHGVKVYSLNLIVRDSAWEQPAQQALARRLTAAALEGQAALQRDPAEAARTFARLFPNFDRRYVDRALAIVARQLGGPPLGGQTEPGWQSTLDHLARLGLLQRPLMPAQVAVLD